MIAIDLQPFIITENIGFKNLINFIDPRYKFHDRHYYSRTLMPELYEKQKTKIKELLNNSSNIAVTTDIWTSAC